MSCVWHILLSWTWSPQVDTTLDPVSHLLCQTFMTSITLHPQGSCVVAKQHNYTRLERIYKNNIQQDMCEYINYTQQLLWNISYPLLDYFIIEIRFFFFCLWSSLRNRHITEERKEGKERLLLFDKIQHLAVIVFFRAIKRTNRVPSPTAICVI